MTAPRRPTSVRYVRFNGLMSGKMTDVPLASDSILAAAFTAYRAQVDEIVRTGEWWRYADAFTEDAVYRRRGYDDFEGREEIRAFVLGSMGSFPGNQIARFEAVWRSFDSRRAQVVYELQHVMRDPGDGSVHTASTLSLMTYAGEGLWSRVTDVQSVHAYTVMLRGWTRVARDHGTLADEDLRVLASLAP